MSVPGNAACAMLAAAACSPSSHEAVSEAQLGDEIQIVAAAARTPSVNEDRRTWVCVDMELGAPSELRGISTASLDAAGRYRPDSSMPDDSPQGRRLTADAVRNAIGAQFAGPCPGTTFHVFQRPVLSGNRAVLYGWENAPCGAVSLAFLLVRRNGAWTVRQQRVGPSIMSTVCDEERAALPGSHMRIRR